MPRPVVAAKVAVSREDALGAVVIERELPDRRKCGGSCCDTMRGVPGARSRSCRRKWIPPESGVSEEVVHE
eukprot:5548521-Alexandrium_andersonii.AAC.1